MIALASEMAIRAVGLQKARQMLPAISVFATFVCSRVIARAWYGLSYDTSSLTWFWQYLDPELLTHDLWRSLWVFHAQPPGFNIFLGIALRAGRALFPLLCEGTYMALGLLLTFALYGLQRRWNIPASWSALITCLFVCSPPSILYEKWLFYSYPVAACVTLAAFCLACCKPGSFRAPLAYVALIITLAYLRSLYHIVWIVPVIVLVALVVRRRHLAWILAPVVLVSALYLKNAIQFGFFGTSSWMGMSLAKLAIDGIDAETLKRLARNKVIHRTSLAPTFSPPERYLEQPIERPALPHHPALDALKKSTSEPNFNHFVYPLVARNYMKDSLAVIARYPHNYLSHLAHAWWTYSKPSAEYWELDSNRRKIAGLHWMYNVFVFGVPGAITQNRTSKNPRNRVCFTWMALLAAAMAWTIYDLRHQLRRRRFWLAHLDGPAASRMFVVFTILFTALAGNTLEVWENNRFRFETEPLQWALIAYAAIHFLRRRPTPQR